MTKMDESLLIRLSEPVGMIRGLVASKTAETIALIGAGGTAAFMRKIVGELAEGVNVNHFRYSSGLCLMHRIATETLWFSSEAL